MLQKIMDLDLFLYGMAASGALGFLGMLAVHLTYRRRLKNTGRLSDLKEKWLHLWKSRDRLLRRMNHWVWYPSLASVFFLGMALFGAASLNLGEGISMRYLYIGISIPIALVLLRQILDFSYKEDLMVDSLADYIDHGKEKLEEMPRAETDPGVREAVVEQITRSIRESAAAGSRFRRLLSPEEEQLMREIIREFID